MDNIFAISSSSVSTTYGNISHAIKEHILSRFPRNYFAYTGISTEMPFRNMQRILGRNTSTEMVKRGKPYLYIRPIYTAPDKDLPLNDIPMTRNFDYMEVGIDKRYLMPILKDEKNGYSLKYKMNRDRIEFEVTVVVETQMEQLNLAKMMHNYINWDRAYQVATSLEALLPRSIVSKIARICELDISRPESTNAIPILINHMNQVSAYPITYKMKNSSGNDEFFMYYNHGIIIEFSDFQLEDGNNHNVIMDDFKITFKVTVDFNLPAMYFLQGTNRAYDAMQASVGIINEHDETKEYIPFYTYTNLYSAYPPVDGPYKLYITSIFTMDNESIKDNVDYLNIGDVLDNNVIKVMQETLRVNVDMNLLMKIIILKDRDELEMNKDWYMNWNTMNVELHNPDTDATYRIIIYLNSGYLNSRMMEIADQNNTDKRN